MSGALIEPVILAVTLSMAATPLVVALAERLAGRLERNAAPPPSYDPIEDDKPRVIIIGFGRFGQIVARILSMKRIRFTALESNLKQVEVVRRYGHKVYFGDATRLETLRAAGLGDCEVVILSIVNPEVSVKVAEMIKKHFPRVKVFARARNRAHAYRLLDAGVDYVIRETFLSAVELARNVLRDLGLGPEEAEAMARAFVEHDEALLKRQWAVAHDEAQLIASAKAAAQELQSLFEEDAGTRLKDAAPERGPDGRGA
ncbi:MAG: hypothetical protein KatS3mg121_0850 [Gammaproteobacteria bacterium]|nr:MAG: hypothetical protein KatS3mg121_0850 [Gammaproteobacteria bacterium]